MGGVPTALGTCVKYVHSSIGIRDSVCVFGLKMMPFYAFTMTNTV